MSRPGSLAWFAQHETRLAWRDTFAIMGAGRPGRMRSILLAVTVFLLVLHVIAHYVVGPLASRALDADLASLVGVTVGILLAASAILSQAMESVTRTFYSRSDLELILTSPASAQRLFAVRVSAIVMSVSIMSLLFVGPFINMLAVHGGVRWLAAYGVIPSIALLSTALAILLTVALFRACGPKRTRLISQIAAAIIGGLFAIGLQLAALFSTGTLSRLAYLGSSEVLALMPEAGSAVWLPARAVLGDVLALLMVLVTSGLFFLFVASRAGTRFAELVLAASSAPRGVSEPLVATRAFRVEAPADALRRKEVLLILRDPWLVSQSLMQLLYLVPPGALLWHSYAIASGPPVVLVPVLAMASGQLAGALAWLTISGEDAPDLVLTAPVSPERLLLSKLEAVMLCVGVVFLPFVAGLLTVSTWTGGVALLTIAASASSATAIQFWFRAQARRSQFRRRHTSSRIATLSEAFVSVLWAGAAGAALAGSDLWPVIVVAAVGFLSIVWRASPTRITR